MKIVYVSFGSHFEIAIEPILEVLSKKGHEVIKYNPVTQRNIPKDTDVVLLTSNVQRPINLDKRIRTYFVPHGLGQEYWEESMNHDTKVFLAGKRPWNPPRNAKNWKIVGWAKTDVLFNPKKDKVNYVNNLMSTLPYDKSVLYIPSADVPDSNNRYSFDYHFLVDYFDEQRINVIAPYREFRDYAIKHFKNYKHIAFPEIRNLYYFASHIGLVVCVGYTSVSREFYITKTPSIHLIHGYPETLNLSNPNRENFDRLFSTVWDNPNSFIQPDHVVKNFIEINDGKVVERIIKEIEQ